MQNKFLYIIIGIIAVVIAFTLFSNNATDVKKVSGVEAREILKEDNSYLVDVRTLEEYNAGNLPNSILIPLDTIKSTIQNEIPNKDSKIIVYCRSGNRSSQAANILIKQGYTNVYDLGSINEW